MLPLSNAVYVGISAYLIFIAGRQLHRSWWMMLSAHLGDRDQLAESMADQLMVRFYALSGGFMFLALAFGDASVSASEAVLLDGTRIGALLIVMAIIQVVSLRSLVVYRDLDLISPVDWKERADARFLQAQRWEERRWEIRNKS
ncbi:hypothetical protein V6C03_08965 [Methyloligella sp. 2.7D]|uniref:hypothetical protein n=1 Tax=unclassified Methyloligella TaxID=2625955 RepID=UPI00157E032B|nr:hypothetical protein [Methyloligella sp. GL2]QKP78008.1 hypothetical protein HT051_11485 [Methyloligella sp. GL2]